MEGGFGCVVLSGLCCSLPTPRKQVWSCLCFPASVTWRNWTRTDTSVAAVHTSALFNDDQTPKTMLPVQCPSISSPKVRMTAAVTIYWFSLLHDIAKNMGHQHNRTPTFSFKILTECTEMGQEAMAALPNTAKCSFSLLGILITRNMHFWQIDQQHSMVNLISATGIDMKYHLAAPHNPFVQRLVTTSLQPRVPVLYLSTPKWTQLPAKGQKR